MAVHWELCVPSEALADRASDAKAALGLTGATSTERRSSRSSPAITAQAYTVTATRGVSEVNTVIRRISLIVE